MLVEMWRWKGQVEAEAIGNLQQAKVGLGPGVAGWSELEGVGEGRRL